MAILLTVVHVIVSVILILVVLLQTGKRADLAGAFGGGGSQTAFGTRGAATFLSKATTAAAVLFMLTSLGLSLVSSQRMGGGGTVLPDDAPTREQAPAPDTPAELPPTPDTGLGDEAPPAAPEGEPSGEDPNQP